MTDATPDYDAIDFFRGTETIADPYPYFDWLRGQCPVHRDPKYGVYMVTGYDEAFAVYTDNETFSSCNSVTGPFPGFPVPLEGREDVSELIEQHRAELPFSDQIITMDPPLHRDHRHLLMRQLTPKRLKENEDFMWQYADHLIDGFLSGGTCEMVGSYAEPFTLTVIADLEGVPESDHSLFRERLSTVHEAVEHKPLEFLYERFTGYIEDRRRNPGQDVLSGLATATFPDGSTPEVKDAALIAANLFAGGQETTVRLLSFALRMLGERPDLQKLVRDDRDLIPNFIEETLRLESPLRTQFRMARVKTELGGVEIPAGSSLMLVPGACNRDPRMFEDPYEFDINRPNARQHIAFGFGIHTCAGAPLARAEGKVTVNRFLDRTSDIAISEKEHGPAEARTYEYLPTFFLRGLQRLYLELAPAG
jgi:cytochrome P450 family 150 subfamily A5